MDKASMLQSHPRNAMQRRRLWHSVQMTRYLATSCLNSPSSSLFAASSAATRAFCIAEKCMGSTALIFSPSFPDKLSAQGSSRPCGCSERTSRDAKMGRQRTRQESVQGKDDKRCTCRNTDGVPIELIACTLARQRTGKQGQSPGENMIEFSTNRGVNGSKSAAGQDQRICRTLPLWCERIQRFNQLPDGRHLRKPHPLVPLGSGHQCQNSFL